MKLLILYDKGSNNEDELDTLEQVEFVKANANCEVLSYQVGGDILAVINEIEKIKPDLVFNLIENRNVHVVPFILDTLGIKYTGNPASALFLTTNKILFRKMLPSKMTPKFISTDEGRAIKGKKYIVKPIAEDASVGIDENSVVIAENTKQIRNLIKKKTIPSFAEEYIKGREVCLAMFEKEEGGYEILTPREVKFSNFSEEKPKILCYKAKWEEGSFEYENIETVRNDFEDEKDLLKKLIKYADICWHTFNLRGYARVDFRIDENNNPYILEINANPCINSSGCGFCRSFLEKGYKHQGLIIERLINVAKR